MFDSIKDYKKANLTDNADFILMVKNNLLNNDFQKVRKYNQKEFKNNQLDRSEENIKIQNIQITNYIFNNKENKDKTSLDISDEKNYNIKEENKRCLTKKLSMNQNNQTLSLSLVSGNVDYNLLLNHSPSKESRLIFPKDKDSTNNYNQLNNDFINSTIQESQKNINNETNKNIKEFPFDHFISNSSMNIHIQKTIFNNKMIKIKRLRNLKKKEANKHIEIQDKEPNDNMRRRNNKIRNEMPLDNLKKEKNKEKKEIKSDKVKPVDNYLKTENINDKNKNKNNIDLKKINKYPSKENINKMNIDNEIMQNNLINDKNNKRNYSVRNKIFREQKKRIYSEVNENQLLRDNKENLQQNKCLKDPNTEYNERKNIFKKNNVLTNKIIKVEKITETNKNLEKNKINNSLVKTQEVKYFRDRITGLEIDKIKNRNINKKARSVNKKNEFRFNKDKEKSQSMNSSKNIIKEQKKLSKIKKITKIKANIINEMDINKKNEKVKNIEENKIKIFDNNEAKFIEMKSIKNNELIQRETKNLDDKLICLKEKDKIIGKDEAGNIIDNNKNSKNNIEENEIYLKRKENHIIDNNIKENNSKDITIKEKDKSKNTGSNKKEEKFKVIIEKEIVEDKYDNFKVKEVYRYKEFIKTKNSNSSKNIKNKIFNNKENNLEKNIRFSDIKNKNNKLFKRDLNEKKRVSLKNNKPLTHFNLKLKKWKKELKLSLYNIKQNSKENSILENKTPRLNFDAKRKLSNIDKQKIKIDSHFAYPKKIGSDINSSNSSIYEYDKPENFEENNINLSKKKEINFSYSDSKVKKYSKNQISYIKKIEAFSEISCDNDTNNYKSKSSNILKNFKEQNEFEFKIEKSINQINDNINDLNKEENKINQKLKKMQKNKTDFTLNKNLEINKFNNNKQIKKLKKENSNTSKKINKIIKVKYYNSKNNKQKNIKKKYRKSLTESEKDKNETKGNDSESYIIEGDSEYGDANVF